MKNVLFITAILIFIFSASYGASPFDVDDDAPIGNNIREFEIGVSNEGNRVNSFFSMGTGINNLFSMGIAFDIFPLSIRSFDLSGKMRIINTRLFGTSVNASYNNDDIFSVNLIQRFEVNNFILYLNGGIVGDSVNTKSFGISLQYNSLMNERLNLGAEFFGSSEGNIDLNSGIGGSYTFGNGLCLYGGYKYGITENSGFIVGGIVFDF